MDILEKKIRKLKYRTEIEQEEELRYYLKEINRENVDIKKFIKCTIDMSIELIKKEMK